ncbi:hypothetical protein EYF80_011686 [Liparis tanakae]|uniref:Uncharacterized protein n=1 Tax=Liparis tanakae TaxID=230148 RepID=A0A4Z2IK95_9TELE|nr:hypothetical protein EYF80_011686 [Liparis tanakae]
MKWGRMLRSRQRTPETQQATATALHHNADALICLLLTADDPDHRRPDASRPGSKAGELKGQPLISLLWRPRATPPASAVSICHECCWRKVAVGERRQTTCSKQKERKHSGATGGTARPSLSEEILHEGSEAWTTEQDNPASEYFEHELKWTSWIGRSSGFKAGLLQPVTAGGPNAPVLLAQ